MGQQQGRQVPPEGLKGAAPRKRGPRRATYRLQLRSDFTFHDAALVAGYLARLGVSHVYLSPVLQAAKGSTHGYDVVDPAAVNDELGGDRGYVELQKALGEAGLGQVVDIVPNHMGVSTRDNRWWWDVLENGPSSVYASHFDIDWHAPDAGRDNVVLVPILGDHYGRELEAGHLKLKHSAGSFVVRYFDHEVPIAPQSLDTLVAEAAHRLPVRTDPAVRAALVSIAAGLGSLPPCSATDRASVKERHRDKQVLRARLAELCEAVPEVAEAIQAEVDHVNAGPDALDALLQRQNYRLAFWQTASEEGRFRRFFDINDLVGIRVEDGGVFADSHRLILRWLRDGVIDGLRIDHIDGLRDPATYLERLNQAGFGVWALVEKVLARGEELPGNWPVAGTTGYDWLNLAGGLFVTAKGAEALRGGFRTFTGAQEPLDEVVHQCKLEVLSGSLSTDLTRLVEHLVRVCEARRRHSDHTRRDLRACLAEVIACFNVYRTYVPPGARPQTRMSPWCPGLS